ncbi:unnamed protein product [Closterium sp. Yama58-4]|nr:unnamed protein product [Closterium sp. Yama58-4]
MCLSSFRLYVSPSSFFYHPPGGLLIAMGLVTGLHALVLFTAPGAIALVLLAAVHAAFGAWLLQGPSNSFLLIISLWLAAQALSKLFLAALWSLVSSYVVLVVTAVVGMGLAGVAYFGFDANTPKWAQGVLVGGYLVLYGVAFLLIACMAYAGELGGTCAGGRGAGVGRPPAVRRCLPAHRMHGVCW